MRVIYVAFATAVAAAFVTAPISYLVIGRWLDVDDDRDDQEADDRVDDVEHDRDVGASPQCPQCGEYATLGPKRGLWQCSSESDRCSVRLFEGEWP